MRTKDQSWIEGNFWNLEPVSIQSSQPTGSLRALESTYGAFLPRYFLVKSGITDARRL
jgi:hypothetical protein